MSNLLSAATALIAKLQVLDYNDRLSGFWRDEFAALKAAVAEEQAHTDPLCPDSPDGNHHIAPIGSDEEWMPSKAPCYYCGDKQVELGSGKPA